MQCIRRNGLYDTVVYRNMVLLFATDYYRVASERYTVRIQLCKLLR